MAAAEAAPVDFMEKLEIVDSKDSESVVYDNIFARIILDALTNNFNWNDDTLLFSKIKKFSKQYDFTLLEMESMGIEAAKSYSRFSLTKANNGTTKDETDLYSIQNGVNNKTSIDIRINSEGDVFVKLLKINDLACEIIKYLGPIYLYIYDIMDLEYPKLSDNIIYINMISKKPIPIFNLENTITIKGIPNYLRGYNCINKHSGNIMNLLPRVLEYLKISRESEHFQSIISELKTLEYSNRNFYKFNNFKELVPDFRFLNYGIKQLFLDAPVCTPLSDLPPTVEIMYISQIYSSLVDLPHALRVFGIGKNYEPDFCKRSTPEALNYEDLLNQDYKFNIDECLGCGEKHMFCNSYDPREISFNDNLEHLLIEDNDLAEIILKKIVKLPKKFKKITLFIEYQFLIINNVDNIDDFDEKIKDKNYKLSEFKKQYGVNDFVARFPNVEIECIEYIERCNHYVDDFIKSTYLQYF